MSDDEKLQQSPPKQWAAGMPAIASSMSHILREAGPSRGLRGLMEMNQIGGFDCPSCAWPDPDSGRSLAEFCENGAKALASESTRNLADADFFAKHSVSELASKSDHWHEQQGRIAMPMVLRQGATHYSPVSWEDAFAILASHLKMLPSPDVLVSHVMLGA